MSVKAAQTLHHKRTLSSLNRPSPGTPASATQPSPAASSPERAQKRARFEGLPLPPPAGPSPSESKVAPSPAAAAAGANAIEKDKRGSAGVQWILGQIKIMEQQYKEAVIAAVLIMQHKAYSRKFRMKSKTIPIHLSQRLEYAWAAYEATRRHIEFYLIQCAEYNATASKPAPASLPPPVAIPSRLTPQTVASSPVPLSTAGLMGLSPSDASRLANLASRPAGLPSLPDGALVFNTGSGDGGLDLGNMNIDELNAIINGSNFDFSNIPPPNPSGATPAGGGGGDISAMTPNTQAETDRLIASLSDLDGGQVGNPNATPGGDDVDSLLARLAKNSEEENGGDSNFQFDFNTDLGDLDLGNLSELAGLFDSASPSQGGTGTATPAVPAKPQAVDAPTAAIDTTAPPVTAPAQPVLPAEPQPPQPPPQQEQQPQQQQQSALTDLEGLLGDNGVNGSGDIDLNLEGLVDGGYDLEGGINMDDFDFGDGQIPSVDGEDFDAMFKDFQ